MKQKLCIIMMALLSMGAAKMNAQVRLGAEVGVNMASLGVRGNHAMVLPTGGLVADYQFKNNMMISSGLHYVMKGANTLSGAPEDLMVRLGYLELPVMVGYRMPVAEHVYLVPQVGAYFACGVNGYAEFNESSSLGIGNTDGVWYNPFEQFDLKNEKKEYIEPFERFDAGLRFALSADVYKFNLSLAYDLGLKRTHKHFDPEHYFKYRNRSVAVTLGYKFNL